MQFIQGLPINIVYLFYLIDIFDQPLFCLRVSSERHHRIFEQYRIILPDHQPIPIPGRGSTACVHYKRFLLGLAINDNKKLLPKTLQQEPVPLLVLPGAAVPTLTFPVLQS
jgi:hypothetical protein